MLPFEVGTPHRPRIPSFGRVFQAFLRGACLAPPSPGNLYSASVSVPNCGQKGPATPTPRTTSVLGTPCPGDAWHPSSSSATLLSSISLRF